MRLFNKILFCMMGAALFAVSSCSTKEAFTPGEPEETGCFGVYFPAQEIGGAYDPADDFTFNITLERTNEKGAITVPVKIEGTGAKYVVLDNVTFADGQKETVVEGSFSKDIPAGETFDVTVLIDDFKYASKYSSKPSFLAFDLTVESWKYLGEGTFCDRWLDSECTYPAKFYQNEADPNRYRVTGGYEAFWKEWAEAYQKGGWVLTSYAEKIEFKVMKPGEKINEGITGYETEITRDDIVYYDKFKIGLNHPSYAADIYRYHPADLSSSTGNEANFVNNRVDNWQDPDPVSGNKLPSVVYLASSVYMPGVGGWGGYESTSSALTLVFPGGKFVDYSLDIEPGTSVEGELPIVFNTGKDVVAVAYSVYQGELTNKEIRTKKALIAAGEEPAALPLDMETKSVLFSADTTSQFTIVAVAYDKNLKEQSNANAVFGYVKKGDEESVKIIAGASLDQPSEAYQAVGYSPITSLTFNVYGKNLKKAAVNIYPKEIFDKYEDECWESLESAEEEDLKKINEPGGYTGAVKGLSPLTEYVLLVSVDNGYQTAKYTKVCKTDGLPMLKLSEGTYSTEALFEDTGKAELWFNPNTTNEFSFEYNFGSYMFKVNADYKIDIPAPQAPGFSDKSYGTLYVGEVMEMMKAIYPTNYAAAIAYYENLGMEITSIAGTSAVDEENKTFNLAMCYYLSAGYIGTGVDTFTVDPVTQSLDKKVSNTPVKFVKVYGNPQKPSFGADIDWDAPQFEREVKAADCTIKPVSASINKYAIRLSKPLTVVE